MQRFPNDHRDRGCFGKKKVSLVMLLKSFYLYIILVVEPRQLLFRTRFVRDGIEINVSLRRRVLIAFWMT